MRGMTGKQAVFLAAVLLAAAAILILSLRTDREGVICGWAEHNTEERYIAALAMQENRTQEAIRERHRTVLEDAAITGEESVDYATLELYVTSIRDGNGEIRKVFAETDICLVREKETGRPLRILGAAISAARVKGASAARLRHGDVSMEFTGAGVRLIWNGTLVYQTQTGGSTVGGDVEVVEPGQENDETAVTKAREFELTVSLGDLES